MLSLAVRGGLCPVAELVISLLSWQQMEDVRTVQRARKEGGNS